MKHKKLKLLALPLAIASASAIGMVSGTLAYFTSQDKATVSIEAGQVKVSLLASDLKVYSLGVEQTDTGTVGEKTVTYFENHGYAYMEDNIITLDRITPGDKVTFDVKFKNESNVDVKYAIYPQYLDEVTGVGRTDSNKVVPHTGDTVTGTKKLSQGLTFTYTNESSVPYDGSMITIAANSPDVTHKIAIELPADAGDEYQGAKGKIVLSVYAIQNNGPMAGVVFNQASLMAQGAVAGAKLMVTGSFEVTSPLVEIADGVTIFGMDGTKPTIDIVGVAAKAPFLLRGANHTFENVIIRDLDKDHQGLFATDTLTGHSLEFNNVDIISGFYSTSDLSRRHGSFSPIYHINGGGDVIIDSLKFTNSSSIGFYQGWCCVYSNWAQGATLTIDGGTYDAAQYPFHVDYLNSNVSYNIKNATLQANWSYSEGCGEMYFENVHFEDTDYHPYKYVRPYSDTTFKNCRFDTAKMTLPVAGCTVILDGCYVDDPTTGVSTLITADYWNNSLKSYYADKRISAATGTEKFVIGDVTVDVYDN